MPITRQQANALLSVAEMELYDESRANPLRKLDAAALEKRIERMRNARQRARDLVQRQKLASREATGSKRGTTGVANQRSKDKAALLDDILKRFEGALKATSKSTTPAAKKTAAAAPTATAAPAKRSTSKPRKSTARVASRTALRKEAGDAGAAAKAPARKTSARDVAAKKRIQATRSKKKLLEKKTARDREPKAWQALDAHGTPSVADAGFQSSSAASKAKRLHAGESRMKPIQGSASTRGKRNQAKRDSRNG
jgi:hypothetical protein